MVLFVSILTGCTYYVQDPVDSSGLGKPSTVNSGMNSKEVMYTDRIQDSLQSGQGSLQSRKELEHLQKKIDTLQEENIKLKEENATLKANVTTLTADNHRMKKQLAEADEFMRSMDKDISKWKAQVDADRKENRKIQKAQLEALTRILRSLGAQEIKTDGK